jgi:HEAT repeat protein
MKTLHSFCLIAIPYIVLPQSSSQLQHAMIVARVPEMMYHLKRLEVGTTDERISSAQWLGERKKGMAVSRLIDNLKHPNSTVRVYAAWALGEIGDKSAVVPLIRLLENEEREYNAKFLKVFDTAADEITYALEKLTGQSYGSDADAWIKYGNSIRQKK